MNKLGQYILLITLFGLFTSCVGIYEDGTELADQAKERVEEISVDSLNAKIERGDDFLLIDIRQPKEYYTDNIPGSILLPRGILEFEIMNDDFWAEQYLYPPLKDSTEVIIYCKSGKRGILATESLMQLGFKNVKNLEDGYDAFNPNQDPNAEPKKASGGCGG